MKIKFGTDGWRAIIGDDYTLANLARVATATAQWILSKVNNPTIVIGYDCRFGGVLFSETVIKVLCKNGVKVISSKSFSSTPMVSYVTKYLNADLGIVITASHNPASFNGFKLKGAYGGPLLVKEVQEVEDLIKDNAPETYKQLSINNLIKEKQLKVIDFLDLYKEKVSSSFDLKKLQKIAPHFAYDAMFGAGQDIMANLLPDISFLNNEINPSFNDIPPEPIEKNLQALSQTIKLSQGEILSGMATDGDADRIGLYNEKGEFVDSHHIILLLIHYLVTVKKLTGKVIFTFSVTPKVKKLCEHFKLDYTITKVGFKYIAKYMLNEDVLIGGEESGGIAIKGHLPERDGVWIGLTLWSYMLSSGKTLTELIAQVYKIVGEFKFERADLHVSQEKKEQIMMNLESGYKNFKSLNVIKQENLDGFKYHFKNDEWIMIRPSGTEPVLRVYAEAKTSKRAFEILKIVESILLKS